MNPRTYLTGCNILKGPSPKSAGYVPKTWPPEDNFPIIADSDGNVISIYSDSIWILTQWTTKVTRINFGDGRVRKGDPGLDKANASILRQLCAIWLYGPSGVRSVNALTTRFDIIRTILIFCSTRNIVATELWRCPYLIAELSKHVKPSRTSMAIMLLHDIWERRFELGFYFLDSHQIKKLALSFAKTEVAQTPYIPPRIWIYQLSRLNDFLEDFISHEEKIADCFRFTWNAYAKSAKSLTRLYGDSLKGWHNPFLAECENKKIDNSTYFGYYTRTIEAHGIKELIERWIENVTILGSRTLTAYMNLASYVAIAYICNFSLMRISEAASLRSSCFIIELDDELNQQIFLLKGKTTKTIDDEDARWITAPSVELAVKVLKCVSNLRMLAATANPNIRIPIDERNDPYLFLRPSEPWSTKRENLTQPTSIRPHLPSYDYLRQRYPKLFDERELCIREDDLHAALKVTPSLNLDIYGIGKTWRLAWHQLRRSGAVNMMASGAVSDCSIQYQLKHTSRSMSHYYGRGYYHADFSLDSSTRSEYIRTMYDLVASEFLNLQADRYFSLHGDKRKQQIIELTSLNDHEKLVEAAKQGKISYRPIMFGGCTNPSPCPYGGIDYVARCGGGDGNPPCKDLIIDCNNHSKLFQLRSLLENRLLNAPPGSALENSLLMQKKAVEIVINAIEQK